MGSRQKKRSFYGHADRKGWPPPYGQGVVIFSKWVDIFWLILSFYNGKNWTKMFTFAYGQGRGGWIFWSFGKITAAKSVARWCSWLLSLAIQATTIWKFFYKTCNLSDICNKKWELINPWFKIVSQLILSSISKKLCCTNSIKQLSVGLPAAQCSIQKHTNFYKFLMRSKIWDIIFIN